MVSSSSGDDRSKWLDTFFSKNNSGFFFRVYMISEDEWSLMKSNFTVDKEISVSRNKTDNAEFFATEPPVCDECLEKRCREEEEEQLIYR